MTHIAITSHHISGREMFKAIIDADDIQIVIAHLHKHNDKRNADNWCTIVATKRDITPNWRETMLRDWPV